MWRVLLTVLVALACADAAPASPGPEEADPVRSRFFDRLRTPVSSTVQSTPVPEHPPENGRLLYLLEGVGVTTADAGTTIDSWTDPTTARVLAAASAGIRPLNGGGFPNFPAAGLRELTSGPAASLVLSAGARGGAAIIRPTAAPSALHSLVLGDASDWWWVGVRETAPGSGQYVFVAGHWVSAAAPNQRRSAEVPILLNQTSVVWWRHADGVVTAGVNSLDPGYTISASNVENVATNVAVGGRAANNTQQFTGDVRAIVQRGAHTLTEHRQSVQSLAKRAGVTLVSNPSAPMLFFPNAPAQSNGIGRGSSIPTRTADPRTWLYGWDGVWYPAPVEPLLAFKTQLALSKYPGISPGSDDTSMWMAFADRLRVLVPGEDVGVAALGVGGTTTAQWLDSLTVEPPPTNKMIGVYKLHLRNALLRSGVKIGAIVLTVGEANATSSTLANQWPGDMTAICDHLAQEFAAYFYHPTLRFILHRMYTQQFAGAVAQAQLIANQDAWAAARSDTIVVTMPDPPNPGDVHLESAQLVTLGEATADAWFNAAGGFTIDL